MEPAGDESPFAIDRRRIINCMAFRRLGYKTQVFLSDVGDHYRTRLTHTLEVASQACRLGRSLRLNETLADAVALAHDLGHAPFGHAGEVALNELMAGHGGFEHNRQSHRVVDFLEHPYPGFRGLNLSFETRESLVKHHTTYDRPDRADMDDDATRPLLDAGPSGPLEGQVVNIADAIAFTLHDIEDGIGQDMLNADHLGGTSIWRDAVVACGLDRTEQNLRAVRRPILDQIAVGLVSDAVTESRKRNKTASIQSVDDARSDRSDLIAFSPGVAAAVRELQALLAERVYANERVAEMDRSAGRVIRGLFQAFVDRPERLPARFSDRIADQGDHRVICDYIAGMTDRFCRQEHERLAS